MERKIRMENQQLASQGDSSPGGDSWQSTIAMLDACLLRAQQGSPVSTPAELRRFIPVEIVAANAATSGGEASFRLILVELIKFDMSAAAEAGVVRPLQEYLTEFRDELPPQEVPADLVLEACQIERESGLPLDVNRYCLQFPHLKDL